jgi:hypothetical protein
MKTFYYMWTYVANYSGLREIQAESAEDALQKILGFYPGDHFRSHGRIYVFGMPPVATHNTANIGTKADR